MISRFLISLSLLVLGGIVYYMHLDLVKLNDSITKMSEQVSNIKIEPLQRAPIVISKPRVPGIKYLPKKAPTVIDAICKH